MTASKPKPGPPIVCRVCGTENPSTRQFCRKCASDLRAPLPAPGAAAAPEPQPIPMRPILIGGGIALAVVVVLLALLALLGGQPAASPTPSPTLAPPPSPTVTGLPSPAATVAPPTIPPPSAPPATPAGPTPLPEPRILDFDGPASVDCGDPSFPGFITLTWRVADADGVTISIDGPGIFQRYPGLSGSAELPYACGGEPHTYLLRTYGGRDPSDTETLVIPPSG